jgi:CubicO group peptidase (beta-lactamase class C family)
LLEFIVTPIGLTNTYVFGQINTNNGECKSYSYTGSWKLESETHFTVPLGAGAITSTPSDLTKFADALFGGKLLTNESLEIMKTIVDNHGIGLFEVSFDKHRGYGHTGGIDGFVSVYSHFADRKISYALISNGRNNIKNKDVSKVVLSAVYGLPYEIPIFTTYTPAPEVLDQYVGIYAAKKEKIKITITKEGNI